MQEEIASARSRHGILGMEEKGEIKNMNVLRRIAMAIAGVVVVALATELVAPKAMHAAQGVLATITNTSANPVPVSGNVNATVTGNVNATLTGTPTVTLNGSVPLSTRSVDNPGLNSFLMTLCVADQSELEGQCNVPSLPTVISTPANSRFVIQYVDGSCSFNGLAQSLVGPMLITILPNSGGNPLFLPFHLNFDRFDSGAGTVSGTTFLSFQQATNIYVDPNSSIRADVDEVITNRPAFVCVLHMSGHTVPLTQ